MPISPYRGNSQAVTPERSGKAILITGGGITFDAVQEVPAGTIDGVNADFTLSDTPFTDSLTVEKNGLSLIPGTGFTLAAATITFLAGYIPQVGNTIYARYIVET